MCTRMVPWHCHTLGHEIRGPASKALGALWLQDHLCLTYVVFSLYSTLSLSSPRASRLWILRASTLKSNLANFSGPGNLFIRTRFHSPSDSSKGLAFKKLALH